MESVVIRAPEPEARPGWESDVPAWKSVEMIGPVVTWERLVVVPPELAVMAESVAVVPELAAMPGFVAAASVDGALPPTG